MAVAIDYRGKGDDSHLEFIRDVAQAAIGRWANIFNQLGIEVPASHKKHGPCPNCGGKDRFRCDDQEGRGTHICSQCGAGDGLELIKKVNSCTLLEAAKMVAPLVGISEGEPWTKAQQQEVERKTKIHRDDRLKKDAIEAQRKIQKAKTIWESGQQVPPTNEYLVSKQVGSYGLRVTTKPEIISRHTFDPRTLIIPRRSAAGELVGVQLIDGEAKRYVGPKKAAYHAIGKPVGILFVCEGYATGATIHVATEHAVAVAFDVGNLRAVAESLKAKLPNIRICIAADNDHLKEVNAGLEQGTQAAKDAGVELVYPVFAEGKEGSDFNDLARLDGIDKVRAALECSQWVKSLEPGGTGGLFKVKDQGVLFMGDDDPLLICSRLDVTAVTRDNSNAGYGRLLEWPDTDGHPHQWAMPMKMTAGDGLALREILLDGGLTISSNAKAKRLLIDYIAQRHITERARCVDKTGWHDGAFVLPDTVIGGESQERVILQTTTGENNHFKVAGTLGGWQQKISCYCVGNSRLVFAVSVAFAAPLLHLINADGGGFNFKGNSSEGKSTALKVATSVCGGVEFMQTWRATDNGLEGIAVNHNDALLPIDEMGQVDPKKAGEIAYMLANGMGKQRAARTGAAKSKLAWRVLFLSTGEVSLADHLSSIGQQAKAGQEVRLADIPMDTGKHGGFEDLHGFSDGAAFADHLCSQSSQYHGVPFRFYIEHISRKDRYEVIKGVKAARDYFVGEVVPKDASGQVKRVAARFGLVAAGGLLATSAGITGWEESEAFAAAKNCFEAWLDSWGGPGNREDKKALEQVVSFFQRHGESRFSKWNGGATKTIDRAGYVRHENGEVSFHVYPEVFNKEVCKGFNSKRVGELCISKGWLVAGSDGKASQVQRLPDTTKPQRIYVFTGNVLGGCDE